MSGITRRINSKGQQHGIKANESVVPMPPELLNLPIITAKPWLQIDPDPDVVLEGPAFDRLGNLFVTSVLSGRVIKITPQKQISIVFENKNIRTDGAAFHKDGRLFVACLTGEIMVMNPRNGKATFIVPKYQDKLLSMNDLVFDAKANLYVTDFHGTVPEPTGGVYRLSSSDYTKAELIVGHLAAANGISLTPESNVLWVGETARNAILRIELLKDGVTVSPVDGVCYTYYSTGAPGGPDSNKIDIEGNLYQCLMWQGRVIILNKGGIPIANVLVPGRDSGKHLRTANLTFKPGTDQAYLCVSGEGGAWIFRFKGLGKGQVLFSHQ